MHFTFHMLAGDNRQRIHFSKERTLVRRYQEIRKAGRRSENFRLMTGGNPQAYSKAGDISALNGRVLRRI